MSEIERKDHAVCIIEIRQLTCHYKVCHQMQLSYDLPFMDKILIGVCKQLIYYGLCAVKPLC